MGGDEYLTIDSSILPFFHSSIAWKMWFEDIFHVLKKGTIIGKKTVIYNV